MRKVAKPKIYFAAFLQQINFAYLLHLKFIAT